MHLIMETAPAGPMYTAEYITKLRDSLNFCARDRVGYDIITALRGPDIDQGSTFSVRLKHRYTIPLRDWCGVDVYYTTPYDRPLDPELLLKRFKELKHLCYDIHPDKDTKPVLVLEPDNESVRKYGGYPSHCWTYQEVFYDQIRPYMHYLMHCFYAYKSVLSLRDQEVANAIT